MESTMKNASGAAGRGAFAAVNSGHNCTTAHACEQFRNAMESAGVSFSGEIIADGILHRFYIEGHRRGTANGAYVLHGDDRPNGWFQDHTTGLTQVWNSGAGRRFAMLSAEVRHQIHLAKIQREAEQSGKHAKAADKARFIWSQSKPIANQSEHPYLISKRIQPHGARLYKDAIVIPIHNEADELINLQFISPEGEKRFLSGGRKRGCFHLIGDISSRILIAEGFATGASLYEDTGQRVVVAFDAGNLLPVAQNVRDLAPGADIIICGDNDASGFGQAKAREAALSIGGKVLIPKVIGADWNDVLTGGNENA